MGVFESDDSGIVSMDEDRDDSDSESRHDSSDMDDYWDREGEVDDCDCEFLNMERDDSGNDNGDGTVDGQNSGILSGHICQDLFVVG